MTDLRTGNTYHGFKLKRSEFIKSMDSTVMSFSHILSGAELVAVKNNDSNKTFCIAFKTIPEDSTGVAHILEHCVLSGSEKFPVKDIFSELYKGGLSTFMNAFTSPDATYYPYSTRNAKEYFNFMNVYLDTTLNPLLKKQAFMQEGWHYEIKDENSPIAYQGIVYNEMKGAMSNPVRKLMNHIGNVMFPSSTYSHNSGGDPEFITDLTYNYFKDFHKKYYHPSNSVIYLYGNENVLKELEFINKNYLSKFKDIGINPEIDEGSLNEPGADVSFPYPVDTSEKTDKKTYISVSTRIGNAKDIKLGLVMQIISNILFNSDASPLKEAVLKNVECSDLTGYFDDGQFLNGLTVFISGSEKDQKQKFMETYFNTLKEIAEKGIDKDLISSELNHIEFKQKEKEISSMRGLIYLNRILHMKTYGIDIFPYLDLNPMLAEVRKATLEGHYFEDMIEKHLLNRDKTGIITMYPDRELSTLRYEKEKKKLSDLKAGLSEDKIKDLIRSTREFIEKQNAEEQKKDIEKVPRLEISDIDKRSNILKPRIEKISGSDIYITDTHTNQIVYLSFGMQISKVPVGLLSYINILTDLFKETGTRDHSYQKLSKDISKYFGGFDFSLSVIDNFKDRDFYEPYICLEVKFMKKYLNESFGILTDIIRNIDLDNKERIIDVLKSKFIHKDMLLRSEGYDFSVTRLKSYISERGKLLEQIKGLSSYYKYKEIYDQPGSGFDALIDKLRKLLSLIFNRNNLNIGIVSDSEGIKNTLNKIPEFIDSLSGSVPPEVNKVYPDFKKDQAFLTSSDVVYDTLGGNLYDTGIKYSGCLEVIKNYLSSDYLFDRIRIKGGAYGAWVYFNSRSGFTAITSYRDPNVRKTYEAYHDIAEDLKNFKMDDKSFNNLKIGAYASFDPLLSPYAKAKKAKEDLLMGVTDEMVERTISEILECTKADIRSAADHIKEFLDHSLISAIGNSKKIKEDSDLFGEIIEIN